MPDVGCEIEYEPGQQCGIAASGRCPGCKRAFCHSHQAVGDVHVGNLWIQQPNGWCTECHRFSVEYQARMKREEEEAKANEWRAEMEALAAIDDPLEALVFAVGRYGPPTLTKVEHQIHVVQFDRSPLDEAMKIVRPGWTPRSNEYLFDDAELASWFARKAKAEGVESVHAEWVTWRKPFGRKSQKRIEVLRGWVLENSAAQYGKRAPGPAIVFEDGRYSPHVANSYSPGSHMWDEMAAKHSFSYIALQKMAKLLGYTDRMLM